MTAEAARGRLAAWVEEQPGRWPLAEAALLLAVDEYPDLDPEPHLVYLDQLAARVLDRCSGPEPPAGEAIAALRDVLFGEEGFQGNTEEYSDPRNSYLNEVLERRTGLPITLSVVVIEVARRAGLPVSGVGFPTHFIVRYEDHPEPHFLDPFHQGRGLSREALMRRWRRMAHGAPWQEAALAALPDVRVLVRVLTNLKVVYTQRQEFRRAVCVQEKLALLEPAEALHQRDLGYLHFACREPGRALGYLERYLKLAPHAEDRDQVLQHLRAISASISRWN
jgi:regulator of sirC expression with transglutaminase-like and TPR domain